MRYGRQDGEGGVRWEEGRSLAGKLGLCSHLTDSQEALTFCVYRGLRTWAEPRIVTCALHSPLPDLYSAVSISMSPHEG